MPPEDPAEWNIHDNLIYGCTLCHRLINPQGSKHERLRELRSTGKEWDLVPVEYSLNYVNYHGPSVEIAKHAKGTVSFCVSMGHIYMVPVDIKRVNLARYKKVKTEKLTIINEDLPYLSLIYHEGYLYNLSAAIILDFVADQALVNLAKAHHKMKIARGDGNTYQTERYNFIMLLDEYLAPPEIKLDTRYGLDTVKFLIRNIDFHNNKDMPIERIQIKSALGKVYKAAVVNDLLVLKYQLLKDKGTEFIWDVERVNGETINKNLDEHPNLPYPYTYHAFRCAEAGDIENLESPSCPVQGDNKVGVFVQSYINSIGSLFDYVIANPSTSGMAIYFEAVATLAEAHQGSTVKYHFMHLDAHGGNFLISTCAPEVRNCSPRHGRMTDFGPYKFRFGTLDYRVYMIDFGFSHFIGAKRNWVINSDFDDEPLHRELFPAYDLITLQRSTLTALIVSFAEWYTGAGSNVQQEHKNVKDALIRVLQVSAAMVAEQISSILSRLAADKGVDSLDSFVRTMYTKHQSLQNLEKFQEYLVDQVYAVANYMFSVPGAAQQYRGHISLLCGIYDHYIHINGNWERYVDRHIYQKKLNSLPAPVMEKLGIRAPPIGLTGIPLYLWYINKYAMQLPILEH